MIAIDLNGDNQLLLDKGAVLTSTCNAKLSLIHFDIHHAPYYSALGLQTYHYSGELAYELKVAAEEKSIDLFILSHHEDLWSNLFSSARNAINVLTTDVLVIPLKD
ncbi:universal stress protein UspA [Serratia fonticola]|uniref:universal stress protein UspA n=1 Tax=Serratia fonticola TaxID=47917 RepID=UPI0028AA8CD3|nr:universal stress protein UspA [Serratia fonticola]